MAHYDISHTCGHDERIELFGPTRDRERRIERPPPSGPPSSPPAAMPSPP